MKKILLALAVIILGVGGIAILKTAHYYSGSHLARKVNKAQAKNKEKLASDKTKDSLKKKRTKEASLTQKARKQPKRKVQKPKQTYTIDLDKFYGSIELTAQQKPYAESIVRCLEDQQTEFLKEIQQLQKNTRLALLDYASNLSNADLGKSELEKLPLQRLHQKLQQPQIADPAQKKAIESIYKKFNDKRQEIRQSQRRAKQIASRMLVALLTKEQKEIYTKEHPRKITSNCTIGGHNES